jgi:predicted TIM-barrel fold metal-dependent hydrolase
MNGPELRQLIDVHHHLVPPGYAQSAGKQRIQRQSGGRSNAAITSWTPQRSLEIMDQCGIATAITSVSTPGTWFGEIEESRHLTRDCNEYGARLARDYPGRFGAFAALPLPDVEGSMREIEYSLDVLKVDGFVLMTSYDNKWPGEREFAPVFDELNRRKAVVYFHPTAPACCQNLITDVVDATIEYMFDTVRAVTSLLYSGTLSRCSDIRFIFSHNGSAVPLLQHRISAPWSVNKMFADRIPNGPQYELKKLYYETAGSTFPESFGPLLQLVTARNLLFGTDYPLGRMTVAETVSGLTAHGFSAEEMRMIERGNALELFPRLVQS